MTRQTDFRSISKQNGSEKFSAKQTPREGNPDHVCDLLRLLSAHPEATHKEFGTGATAFDHILHLAKLFGFVDEKKRLTKSGRGMLALEKTGQYTRMALSLDQFGVVKSWCSSFDCVSFCDLDFDTCTHHLQNVIKGVKKTTLRGRASALKRLCKTLAPYHPSKRIIEIGELDETRSPSLADEPVFGRRVIDVVNRIKSGSNDVRISTGWMSAGGYDMTARGLEKARMKILLGSDDYRGKELLESPLEYFQKSVKTGKPSEEKRNQHIRLYKDLVSGTKRVRELSPKRLDRLHAKGYYFGLQAGLSTSANMTWNGLIGNVESGHVTTNLDHMKYNITEFERYFDMAEDITTPIIQAIEESWIFQEPVKPYLAYLRGLLEVFGNIASETRSETYHLADFQQMIVASALNSLNEFKRAMVISPTGTGKTVMGSYIIASECMNAERKVVIFSPNDAVRRKWEHDTLAFGRHPRIYSHSDLQNLPDNHLESQVGKELQMYIDEDTLIVVDEVHRFRTEGNSGEKNLRRLLNGGLNGKKPRVLFLTATPIGVGFENLETLYSMLFGEGKLSNLSSISSAPGLVNITLPFIMSKFGKLDADGNKYLNYANSKKYFGKRNQYMVCFKDDNSKIFGMVDKLQFTRLVRNPDIDGFMKLERFGFGLNEIPEEIEVENMHLAKLNLARDVNSSRSAAIESIKNHITDIPNKNYAEPEKTLAQLQELLKEIEINFSGKKYEQLSKVIRQKGDSKLLIFTGRIATMEELCDRLSKDFPKLVIEKHVGTANQRQKIRERFAPDAHGMKIKRKQRIDVLISTDSISEGVDLQDANMAIDYDLWWTPLKLQQRMGRLDRPTSGFREFKVIRFVNLTPQFTKIVKIDKYLSERSTMLKKLIADGAYEKYEKRDWNDERDEGIITVMEDGYRDITSSEELNSTSFHIADLANAEESDIMDARKLPSNFHSSLTRENVNGTFTLFRHHGVTHLAYIDHEDERVIFAPGNEPSEKVLSMIRCDSSTPLATVPTNHHEMVDGLLQKVCEIFDYDSDEVELIYSVAIRPNH